MNMQGVTKGCRKKPVVNRLDLSLRQGEVYGLLGHSGAGKTTVLRMAVGLVRPDSGVIELFGKEITRRDSREVRGRVGCVMDVPGFLPNLTGVENLDIHRRLMGVPDREGMEQVLEQTGLTEAGSRLVMNYSLDMRKRLSMARALLHQPEFLILDEPVTGLDPKGIREIRFLLRQLAKDRRVTVLLTSHDLREIQQIAGRVGILYQGELVKELEVDELEQLQRPFLQLTVGDAGKAAFILEEECDIQNYQVVGERRIDVFEQVDQASGIVRRLVLNEVEVHGVHPVRNSLEEYYAQVMRRGEVADTDLGGAGQV